MATRWGFMGSGKISDDFALAIRTVLKPDDHRLVAVAARKIDSAKQFAARHQVEKAHGSYEELAKDEDVEIVYLAVLNPSHFPLAKLCLQNGKAVLCEKPMCMNVKETSELIELARSKKIFLMEGLWSRCLPVYRELRRRLQEKEIGDILQVNCNLGVRTESVERLRKKDHGGGAMLNYGTYVIQLVTFVMGLEKPLDIKAVGHTNNEGVDENVSAVMKYSEGRLASVSATYRALPANDAFIIGTKGKIRILPPFHKAIEMETPSGNFKVPHPAEDSDYNYRGSVALFHEAQHVRECLQRGLLESPFMTFDDSLLVAEIMQEIRTQVGVSYPQD